MSMFKDRLEGIGRRAVPLIKPVLATFVCGLFPLISPIATFMGQYSFLPITILYLFFPPKATIGAQIQSTVFGIGGMLLGLAWSLFGRGIGSALNRQGKDGVAWMAVLLVVAGFFAALVKSLVPRLTSAAMMFLFIAIWGLTNNTDATQVTSRDFLDLFWSTLFTALSTLLICCVILPKTAATVFEDSVLSTIDLSGKLLERITLNFFDGTADAEPLKVALSKNIALMNSSFLEANNEVGISPMHLLEPLQQHLQLINFSLKIDTDLGHKPASETNLRRLDTFDYGSTRYFHHRGGVLPHSRKLSRTPTSTKMRNHFKDSFTAMQTELGRGFAIVCRVITAKAAPELEGFRQHLTEIISQFIEECQGQLRPVEHDTNEPFEIAGLMIRLLQVAHELEDMLQICSDLCRILPSSHNTIRWPDILQAHWWSETRPPAKFEVCKKHKPLRVRLARLLYARHSHHTKFAIKMALGLGLLGLTAWLPSSKEWYRNHRGTWMLISFFYTLESSSGATVRVCALRMLGTIIGTSYALCSVMICQNHPEAIALLVFIAAIPMSYLIHYTNVPSVGVVWAISIPPIIFLPYLGVVQSTPKAVFFVALARTYQIGLGILATLLINLTFWPYHARSRLTTSLSNSTEILTKYYLSISRQNLHQISSSPRTSSERFTILEDSCRSFLAHSNTLLGTVKLELRLLPLPLHTYQQLIPKLSCILDSFVAIRRIRQHFKDEIYAEVVTRVLPQRKQLVSSILLNLFAISKALETRSPLPQFLASPLEAQENLLVHIRHEPLMSDFQYFYFLAEADALRRVCEDIEDTIDLIKRIVGEDVFVNEELDLEKSELKIGCSASGLTMP